MVIEVNSSSEIKRFAFSSKLPLVVIGMPVFNEQRHLEEALSSILNQTHKNILVNIVDNCSTDNTSEICQKFIAMDSRVKYIRNDRNINSGLNF